MSLTELLIQAMWTSSSEESALSGLCEFFMSYSLLFEQHEPVHLWSLHCQDYMNFFMSYSLLFEQQEPVHLWSLHCQDYMNLFVTRSFKAASLPTICAYLHSLQTLANEFLSWVFYNICLPSIYDDIAKKIFTKLYVIYITSIFSFIRKSLHRTPDPQGTQTNG